MILHELLPSRSVLVSHLPWAAASVSCNRPIITPYAEPIRIALDRIRAHS
jgi:hypothetical protein